MFENNIYYNLLPAKAVSVANRERMKSVFVILVEPGIKPGMIGLQEPLGMEAERILPIGTGCLGRL